MTNENFNKLTEACLEEIRETLSMKAGDYAGEIDRLQNFKDAEDMTGANAEYCLWMFVTKHLVALQDYILNIGAIPRTEEQLLEKTGDIAVYLMPLLRGLLIDRGLLTEYAKRIGVKNES